MPFDCAIPRNNSPIVSAELREQLQSIQNNIDAVRATLQDAEPLGLTVSDPPTQAQVQAIADKLEEVIAALRTV